MCLCLHGFMCECVFVFVFVWDADMCEWLCVRVGMVLHRQLCMYINTISC